MCRILPDCGTVVACGWPMTSKGRLRVPVREMLTDAKNAARKTNDDRVHRNRATMSVCRPHCCDGASLKFATPAP